VLVVTHLPRWRRSPTTASACERSLRGKATFAEAVPAAGDDRLVELSRMLSGSPDSEIAREHAAELLATASAAVGRRRKR
jgi:DNA repair protein RecN (Recombination protein N)